MPRAYLCLRLQIVNSAWVPFSESVMFENISEFGGAGIRESAVAALESPAMSSSVIIDSPIRPSASTIVHIGVGVVVGDW